MDCNLPGSSIHGIFQAKVLEWGAIAFSILSLVSESMEINIESDGKMSGVKGSFLFNVYDTVIHNKKYVFDLFPSFQRGTP